LPTAHYCVSHLIVPATPNIRNLITPSQTLAKKRKDTIQLEEQDTHAFLGFDNSEYEERDISINVSSDEDQPIQNNIMADPAMIQALDGIVNGMQNRQNAMAQQIKKSKL